MLQSPLWKNRDDGKSACLGAFVGTIGGNTRDVLRSVDECQLSPVDDWTITPAEEMEAQRGEVTCPRAHSQTVADQGCELTPA